jgi:DNA ligase (NAD+)
VSTDPRGATEDICERVGPRRALIKGHDAQYYLDDASEILDAEYDELAAVEAQYLELVEQDSPTFGVGIAPANLFASVTHRVPSLWREGP